MIRRPAGIGKEKLLPVLTSRNEDGEGRALSRKRLQLCCSSESQLTQWGAPIQKLTREESCIWAEMPSSYLLLSCSVIDKGFLQRGWPQLKYYHKS
jgi:hypothetical protein